MQTLEDEVFDFTFPGDRNINVLFIESPGAGVLEYLGVLQSGFDKLIVPKTIFLPKKMKTQVSYC